MSSSYTKYAEFWWLSRAVKLSMRNVTNLCRHILKLISKRFSNCRRAVTRMIFYKIFTKWVIICIGSHICSEKFKEGYELYTQFNKQKRLFMWTTKFVARAIYALCICVIYLINENRLLNHKRAYWLEYGFFKKLLRYKWTSDQLNPFVLTFVHTLE